MGGRDRTKGSRKRLLGKETCKMGTGKSEVERSDGSILDGVSFPWPLDDPSRCLWPAGVNFS